MNDVVIIMSVYKNDKLPFVKMAVESILTQTYSEFDFTIQFDGSIDNAVEDYLCNIIDNRITIYKRTKNKGLAYSLNELLLRLFDSGEYKYFFRMDADDISLPTRLEKQITFLENHKDVDCVGTWAIEINSRGEEYFRKRMPETHQGCYELFKKRDCLIHPTVAFRKSYFEKAGLYPEDTYFGEDTMMWANGFSNGCKFANIPEYLFQFRLDNDFFDRRRGWKHAKSIFYLRRRVNRLLDYPISTDIYALMYAIAKIMPKSILNLIYKIVR